MSYIVIDMDGATLDEFDETSAVKAFIKALRRNSANGADDLAVIEYADGRRLGSPLFAQDWVARHDSEIFRATLARSVGTVYVGIATTEESTGAGAPTIDLSITSTGSQASEALSRHVSSHQYLLAA